MTKKPTLPRQPFQTVLEIEKRNAEANAQIGQFVVGTLAERKQSAKLAVIMEILDANSGGVHHHVLRLTSYGSTSAGWKKKPEHSLTLSSRDPDEIEALRAFLNVGLGEAASATGRYAILRHEGETNVDHLIEQLQRLPGDASPRLVVRLLTRLASGPDKVAALLDAIEESDGAMLDGLAAARRVREMKRRLAQFQQLLDDTTAHEGVYQRFLAANLWLFGSEYSVVMSRRKWTRDENLDFMVRRTADGYLEVIEIKTPSAGVLMRKDPSRPGVYYPSAPLSQALGQALHYLEMIDADRHRINSMDGDDPLKASAVVVFGRDEGDEERAALRNLNGHLHRVRVMTFDEVARVGTRIVSLLENPDGIGEADV